MPAADLPEEPIRRERAFDVQVMHHADDGGEDPVLAQGLESPHGLPVGRLAALGHAVRVVQFRRAVQAQADAEGLRRQKAAPLVVQQHAVGLDAIADPPAGGLVLALELDGLAEKVHAQDGGLSSMPREANLRPARRLDVLDDVLFQQAVRHPRRAALRVQAAFVPVVAVLAIEIANRPGRFGKDLKIPARLSHG